MPSAVTMMSQRCASSVSAVTIFVVRPSTPMSVTNERSILISSIEIGSLNALSGDDDVAAMRELGECRHDLRGASINANVGDERAIDLDLIDRDRQSQCPQR